MRTRYVFPSGFIETVGVVLSTSFCAVPDLEQVVSARNSAPTRTHDLVFDQPRLLETVRHHTTHAVRTTASMSAALEGSEGRCGDETLALHADDRVGVVRSPSTSMSTCACMIVVLGGCPRRSSRCRSRCRRRRLFMALQAASGEVFSHTALRRVPSCPPGRSSTDVDLAATRRACARRSRQWRPRSLTMQIPTALRTISILRRLIKLPREFTCVRRLALVARSSRCPSRLQ